jgi:hypothetical protein
MTSLAFFLYDNRTWSPRWGRDWGLKAATGALADRTDLKADFDRYCGAMPGDQGQLCGFGEAMGGVRPERGDGYLLCVALESADSFGRPSWAVFGLWCPDPATLEQVLAAGDPVGSARALLGLEMPPSAIAIRPATSVVRPMRRRCVSAGPAFHRFDPKTTVREVAALLLGAVQARTALPNVLGITATSRLAALGPAGFNLVYCHPMDERTERAVERVLGRQAPEVEEPWPPGIEPTKPPLHGWCPEPAPPALSEARAPLRRWWPAVAIVGTAAILLLQRGTPRVTPAISGESSPAVAGEATLPGDTPVSQISDPRESPAQLALGELRERLEELRTLVPEALRQSPGFVAAETLEVVPAHREHRHRVRQAYSALIEIRARMVKRQGSYVAYYYDEAGQEVPAATRLQKIAAILGEAPLGSEDCAVLKEAFGFEFESGDSVVRRWCDSLGRLEKTAVRSLSIPSRHR